MHGERTDGDETGAGRPAPGGKITALPMRPAGLSRMHRSAERRRGPAATPGRDNLIAPLTRFVGREREVAEVARRLGTDRLVTLVGPPGVGKTRLSLRVAEAVRDRFADGVWLVELAGLAEPSLVPSSVAAALGLRHQGGRPLTEALAARLRPEQTLLVLDNCEHLLDACAALVDALLAACPGVRVMATSRERLGLTGEVAWRVPPLTLPAIAGAPAEPLAAGGPTGSGAVDALLRSEAGRLFVERARAARPGFEATAANAEDVARICARVDGIPLAIELAAARVAALSIAQIAARLDDRFALLVGGSRTALPRQRTLRALVDWSHDLLSAEERVLLRRLAVFAGGWTLESAEAVCGPRRSGVGEVTSSSDTRHPTPVVELLTSLVDKSLVAAEEQAGQVRYRLLELLREYGLAKLRDAGEEERLRDRHRDWLVRLMHDAEPELRGGQQVAWLERLEADHDNLRAALRWCVEREAAEPGLQLAWGAWRFWYSRTYLAEGRAWLTRLLGLHGATVDPSLRAKGLFAAGRLAYVQGDAHAARRLFEECLAIATEIEDRSVAAGALTQLGHLACAQGDWAAAASLYEEGLRIRRELGERRGIAISLGSLGRTAYEQGEPTEARPLIEESIRILRELGDLPELGTLLLLRGGVACGQADHHEARACYAEAVTIADRLDDRKMLAQALEGFSDVAASAGRAERALRLAGAAAELRETIGVPPEPADGRRLERRIDAIRHVLGAERSAALWAEGRAMTNERASAYAREGDAAAGPPCPAPVAAGHGLTRREREVAALVARGLTNRQIAEALVVTERTAEWHVGNLIGKLGLASRTRLAVWAAERRTETPRPR